MNINNIKYIYNNHNFRSTFINSIYFIIPSIITIIINIFTTPIFARYLSPVDYSIIGYFTAIGSIYSSFINFSLFSYYMRGYHRHSAQENDHILSSITIFLALANIIFLSINYLGWYIYFHIVKLNFPFSPYLLLVFLNSFVTIYVNCLFMYYKMQKKPYKFMWFSIGSSLINIGLGLFMVVKLRMGATGKLLSIAIANSLIGIIAFFILTKGWTIDWKIIKEAFKLGYPLVLITLISIPVTNLDKIILERINDVVNYSYYTIGMQFSGYLMVMYSSIYQSFEPDIYKYANTDKRKLAYLALFIFGFAITCNLLFTMLSRNIIGFLTSYRYTGATKYANIFIWSNLFILITYFISAVFVAKGRTLSLLGRQIIISVCGLALLFYSINRWGFIGAATTKVIINFLDCLLMLTIGYILLKKHRASFITKQINDNSIENLTSNNPLD